MATNLERERARAAARKAWAAFVWGRTHNVSGRGGGRSVDGGGKISWGNNAVIVRPDKRTKKAMNGEPYGRGNGASRKRRVPSKRYVWPRHRS